MRSVLPFLIPLIIAASLAVTEWTGNVIVGGFVALFGASIVLNIVAVWFLWCYNHHKELGSYSCTPRDLPPLLG